PAILVSELGSQASETLWLAVPELARKQSNDKSSHRRIQSRCLRTRVNIGNISGAISKSPAKPVTGDSCEFVARTVATCIVYDDSCKTLVYSIMNFKSASRVLKRPV